MGHAGFGDDKVRAPVAPKKSLDTDRHQAPIAVTIADVATSHLYHEATGHEFCLQFIEMLSKPVFDDDAPAGSVEVLENTRGVPTGRPGKILTIIMDDIPKHSANDIIDGAGIVIRHGSGQAGYLLVNHQSGIGEKPLRWMTAFGPWPIEGIFPNLIQQASECREQAQKFEALNLEHDEPEATYGCKRQGARGGRALSQDTRVCGIAAGDDPSHRSWITRKARWNPSRIVLRPLRGYQFALEFFLACDEMEASKQMLRRTAHRPSCIRPVPEDRPGKVGFGELFQTAVDPEYGVDDQRGLRLTEAVVDLVEVFDENHMRLIAESQALWGGRKPFPLGNDVFDQPDESGKLIAQ